MYSKLGYDYADLYSHLYLFSLRPMFLCSYLAHGTATDYMYSKLGVPVSLTWEVYGDTKVGFMFYVD